MHQRHGVSIALLCAPLVCGPLLACEGTGAGSSDGGSLDAATSEAGSGLGSSDGGAEISAAELRAQDITILYPYPTAAELPSLLTASSTGERGVLIPQEAFELFPALVSHPRDRENSRDELRVVGVRANCAFDTSAREDPCHGQLQLVFQVLAPAADGTNAEVFDASVHGVYPLDDTTFLSLVRAAARHG